MKNGNKALMEIFGLSITLLTFMLGYLAWRNGKWMKETTNRQTEMINRQTKMIEKQTEMIEKQTEMIEKQTEMIEKQTEIIKEIKDLIVTEHRLTRELMEKIDKTTKEILGKILEKVAD